jgi:branched-chain amino acid transport system substrate-binding protein
MRGTFAARLPLLVALAVGGLALAGCGGSRRAAPAPVKVGHVDIYSSLPLQGAQAARAQAIQSGITLALQQADDRAGRFRIRYRALDDATAAAGGWSVAQVERNARQAAADPLAVYYIGELGSAASEASMPILNDAGIAQLSPAASYVGLTAPLPGAAPGDPARLRPSGRVTFASLMANDDVEAAADLQAMRELGCRRIAVAYQPGGGPSQVGFDSTGQAQTIQALASAYRVSVVAAGPAPGPQSVRAYAVSLRRRHVQCVALAGSDIPAAAAVLAAVHQLLPTASLIADHPLCTTGLAAALTPAADARLQCTMQVAPVRYYPGGQSFALAYRARFHRAPGPWALYGYVAMELGLRAIAALGPNGDDRGAVLRELLSSHARRTPLGRVAFNADGQSTLRAFWLYSGGPGGRLSLYGPVVAPRVLAP